VTRHNKTEQLVEMKFWACCTLIFKVTTHRPDNQGITSLKLHFDEFPGFVVVGHLMD